MPRQPVQIKRESMITEREQDRTSSFCVCQISVTIKKKNTQDNPLMNRKDLYAYEV